MKYKSRVHWSLSGQDEPELHQAEPFPHGEVRRLNDSYASSRTLSSHLYGIETGFGYGRCGGVDNPSFQILSAKLKFHINVRGLLIGSEPVVLSIESADE